MPTRRVEPQLEQLKALRATGASPSAEAALRKALKDKVGIIVAQAASVTAELGMCALLPDLCAAFERGFEKPVETDPQCWAKNALSKALVTLGHTESALFLRGLEHVQMEPVWGGEEDTAATLRGTCALALVSASDLPRRETLRCLVQALTDRAASVRLDAVRALEQMQGEEVALLLRLKARTGDAELAVVGQVFDSLLTIEDTAAIPFVAAFMRHSDEQTGVEAALSLGACRIATAIESLEAAWRKMRNPVVSAAILRGMSASRQEQAIEFLLNLLGTARERDALELHRFDEDLRARIAAAVATRTETEIQKSFAERFATD